MKNEIVDQVPEMAFTISDLDVLRLCEDAATAVIYFGSAMARISLEEAPLS